MASTTTDRRFGVNSGVAVKAPCKAATTANITLSGEQTIDGISCTDGDRVLVWQQTNGVQNGIWVVDTGSWSRAKDANGFYDLVEGSIVPINRGDTYEGYVFRLSTTGIIIPGITSLTFEVFAGISLSTRSYFASVSLMKAATNLANNTVVETDEHTSGFGRAGANKYLIQSVTGATDDNGSIIKLDNGTQEAVGLFPNGLNADQWGADSTGSADSTTAIQAANDFAVQKKDVVNFSAGTYLVTDTINIPVGSQLKGVTGYQYSKGFNIDPKATTINFQPTTQKSLFVASGTTHGGFRFHYYISNFYITGNANSLYCLDLDGVIYGNFSNMGIEGFDYPINCDATINNRFENIYLEGTVGTVRYAGNNETTDVWSQCSFFGSPVGPLFLGSSIVIRFEHCLFEQLDTYLADIAKECQSIQFIDCYAEDCPFTNVSTNAMFRVGHSGTTLATENQIIVIGGKYAGRNAGAVGSFFDADFLNGAIIQGVNTSRVTNVFKTTANTRDNSIVVMGLAGITWTTFANDLDKLSGIYPNGVINSGSNHHEGRLTRLACPTLRANTSGTGTLILDANNVQLSKTGGSVYPQADNNIPLGLSGNRWSEVFAGNGTINTSDEREKTGIAEIPDDVLDAWSDVRFTAFQFVHAIDRKGDSSARRHSGIIAQEIERAFSSRGLDAFRWGVLCRDLIDEENYIYGIRYNEAFCLEAALIRRTQMRLEDRMNAIESAIT